MQPVHTVLAALTLAACCPPASPVRAVCLHTSRDVQAQTRAAEVVAKVLAMSVWPEPGGLAGGHFAVMAVYKGAKTLKQLLHIGGTDLFNISDKRVNVTGFRNDNSGDGHRACGASLTVGTYFVLFADVADGRLVAKEGQGALVEWTDDNERSVWRGLGWGDWSEWSACNVSCNTGLQFRQRRCLKCGQGHNKEIRKCNDFPCNGAMELVAPGDNVRTVGGNLEGLHKGLNLPSRTSFPDSLSLIVSLRVLPKVDFGTVFHLSSTAGPTKTIVLEVSGPDLLRVSVNTQQSNRSVLIAAVLADGVTHQLGLGFQGDEVIAYMDCRWVTTETLMQNSFAPSPEYDTDVFEESLTADLIQLIVVPDSTAVSDQCTIFRIAELDSELIKPKIRDKSHRGGNDLGDDEVQSKRLSKHFKLV